MKFLFGYFVTLHYLWGVFSRQIIRKPCLINILLNLYLKS